VALGSTQPPTEMRTNEFPWGKVWSSRKSWQLCRLHVECQSKD